jgi:hypothetical protein
MAVISFAKDIVPLFDPATDIPHMAKRGVLLADYAYMSDPGNARDILDHLDGTAAPLMPPKPASPWSAENITLFKAWIAGGRQP